MNYLEKADLVKTYAVIAYIAAHIAKEKTNMYNILKAIYLADKAHMEKYGRFILNEDYEAWEKGPVPLKSYVAIKGCQSGEKAPDYIDSPFRMAQAGSNAQNKEPVDIQHDGDIDLDLFSASDLECLNQVIASAANNDLGEEAHDDAWHKCFVKGKQRIPMETLTILGTLQNATELIELHQNPHP